MGHTGHTGRMVPTAHMVRMVPTERMAHTGHMVVVGAVTPCWPAR